MDYPLPKVALALIGLPVALFGILLLRRWRYSTVRDLPGPPSSSWIYGSMRELLLPSDYGEYEYEWQATYGSFYRVKGCFGQDRLMISDPAAVKHIMANPTTFRRSAQQQQVVRSLLGEDSVFHVTGEDHKRIRAVLNPAFAASNIRSLPPLFQRIATKLADKWQVSSAKESWLDVSPTLHRATLDAIGESIVGVQLNTLDNDDNELGRSHHNIIALSSTRSRIKILADGIINYLPIGVLRLALLIPTAALSQLRHNRELGTRLATALIERKVEAFRNGGDTERDLLSLLVNANATTNPSKRITVKEMSDQIPATMVAGQDTTANTIGWCLYELSRDVSAQDRLREEIHAMYAAVHQRGDTDLSYSDLESMTYLNAFVKEILRVYTALPMSEREPDKDVVIPLSQPITTLSGRRITEVPIKKGQHISIATWAYHKLTSVWGPDAHEFKVSRWLDGEPGKEKGGAVGPYANLLSFLGGPRTCIGWRLAITEIQVFVIELVRRFSFTLPEGLEVRKGVAVTLIPITGEGIGKQGLPLKVTLLE